METSGIVGEVLLRIERLKEPVLCNVSNRHIHLSGEHCGILFGSPEGLSKLRDLRQPGEYAARETVDIEGPRGVLRKVRVLGPLRKRTQAEVSRTDTYRLGIRAPLRNSGDIEGSPGAVIKGPRGQVRISEGVIVARRHIHMSPEDALRFRVKDMQSVRVRTRPPRSVVFEDVLVRVSPEYALECHLDTDEANACDLENGAQVFLS